MTTYIQPIIIPKHEPKCPSCGIDENKIEVCKNCGHKYQPENFTFLEVIACSILVLVFLWVFLTLLFWLFISYDNSTLLEIIKSQYEYFSSKKIY